MCVVVDVLLLSIDNSISLELSWELELSRVVMKVNDSSRRRVKRQTSTSSATTPLMSPRAGRREALSGTDVLVGVVSSDADRQRTEFSRRIERVIDNRPTDRMTSSTCSFCATRRSPVTVTSVLVTTVVILICTLVLTAEGFPITNRNGRSGNGNGGSSNGNRNAGATPNGHRQGRPATNGNGSPPTYYIDRPGECANDTVFSDCFLCGKISDDIRIYRACCQRDEEINTFCQRLLS